MSQTATNIPPALIARLQQMANRQADLQQMMNDPAILANSQRIVAIAREAGQLEPVVSVFQQYKKAQSEVEDLENLLAGGDKEMAQLAESELPSAQARAQELIEQLKDQFLAAEDNAVDSFFLEIRAGTGGEEARPLRPQPL